MRAVAWVAATLVALWGASIWHGQRCQLVADDYHHAMDVKNDDRAAFELRTWSELRCHWRFGGSNEKG